jgi:lipopolysaccharide biosynthesis protein
VEKKYRKHNLDNLWKVFPVSRPVKEAVKTYLFTSLPFFFRNWEIYQNWKNSRVFKPTNLTVWHSAYWQRALKESYEIKLEEPAEHIVLQEKEQNLAVVIHVFYPEIFKEIMDLPGWHTGVNMSLYLTGTKQALAESAPLVHPKLFSSVIPLETPNRGRDILPFLNVLPKVFEDGNETVLKLHTKGSNHLNRKEHWRNQLFSKLIGKGSVENALQIFRSNPAIGMIGPAGNILPMHLYYASNGAMVHHLCRQMGIEDARLKDLNFVAGSMFYARREALQPILNLQLSTTGFEPEAAQTDGTLAHAVERAFAAGLIAAGLQLADTEYSAENPVLRVSKVNRHIV